MTSFNSSLAGICFQCIFSFINQDALCQSAELYILYYVNQNNLVTNHNWPFPLVHNNTIKTIKEQSICAYRCKRPPGGVAPIAWDIRAYHFLGGRFLIGTEIFGVDFLSGLRFLGSIFRAQIL